MSLVVCPECGRDKVSDLAELCPECGYPIKQHYETIKRKKIEGEKEKQEQANRIAEEREKIKKDAEIKRQIDAVKMPEEPSFPMLGCSLISLMWLITIVSLAAIEHYGKDFLESIDVIWVCVDFMITIFFCIYRWNLNADYRLASKDFEAYKRMKFYERNPELAEKRSETSSNITGLGMKCPTCGSTKVKQISTLNRFGSVWMFGLASSKVGKTMECSSCGYKW